VSGSFRYNATVTLVERHRFERVRQIGKHYWGGQPVRRL